MNYEKIYSELIFRAKNRSILPKEYVEEHHILPKSMYSEFKKEKWNLVKLFPEEHLIAHLLLVKIYNNPEMKQAAFAMVNGLNKSKEKLNVNSKQYGWIKRQYSQLKSEQLKNNNPYSKYKGSTYEEIFGEEEAKRRKTNYKKWLKENGNPFLGKTHTDETKKKLSEIASKRIITDERKQKTKDTMNKPDFWSDEEKKKRSKRVSGKNNPKSKCLKFINPQGVEFIVEGAFKKFVDTHNLSYYTAQNWIDKGIINSIKNTNSEKSINLIGWEIKLLNS